MALLIAIAAVLIAAVMFVLACLWWLVGGNVAGWITFFVAFFAAMFVAELLGAERAFRERPDALRRSSSPSRW